MKDRKKRNIMIGSLCALLVFMGIGYAIISQMLTIRGVSTVAGDWNIYIDSITPNAVGTGVSITESVGIDKVSASFEANLYAPGDKVEYKVVVKNDGNIDAKLGAVNQHVTNDTEGIVKYSNTLENGYILRHGESYVFYVTTEIEEEKEELPVENTVRAVLELKLNFTQYTGGGSEDNPVHDETTLLASGDISKTSNDNVEWKYYSDGALIISGSGDMLDLNTELITDVTDINSARGLNLEQQIISQILNKDDPITNSYSNMFIGDGHSSLNEEYSTYSLCFINDMAYKKISEINDLGINSLDEYIDFMVIIGEFSNEDADNFRNVCSKIPQIVSIEFEEDSNITSIGSNTFYDLHYYGELSIPNTVITINNNAFENNGITSINFNNTTALTNIGMGAFRDNYISNLVLPNSLTLVNQSAFYGNYLTNVTINGNYSSWYYSVFECNPNLSTNSFIINASLSGLPMTITDAFNLSLSTFCSEK